jgi:peptidoglycan/xylan/chitin deacetylase (PgdA/CDA1 family)
MSAESRLEADCVMTESQLSALLSTGITLGSHTVSHPRLSKLDDSEALRELRDSKGRLEDVFSGDISGIAFPYGDYSQRTLELCREVGYRFAFSIDPEVIDPSKENFLRGRIAVNPTDSPLVFYLKIHGAYSWMPCASRLKKFLVSKLRSKQN